MYIYIASDEWPLRTKKSLLIKQHKTLNERINCANKFINEYKFRLPMYVDNINNDFTNIYSGWPLQAFIIFKNKFIWNIKPKKPGYFDLSDIKSFITKYTQNTCNKYNKCKII